MGEGSKEDGEAANRGGGEEEEVRAKWMRGK